MWHSGVDDPLPSFKVVRSNTVGPILINGYKKVHQNTGFAFLMLKKYTKTEQEFVQDIYRSEIQSLFALSEA